jgi:hypothetical protein
MTRLLCLFVTIFGWWLILSPSHWTLYFSGWDHGHTQLFGMILLGVARDGYHNLDDH